MGNDGGTIVKRLDIVRVKDEAGKESVDPAILARIRATTCALSRQPLRSPIVGDRLGRLFNKEHVVKALLQRAEGEKEHATDSMIAHVRGLKDVKQLKFADNPAFVHDERVRNSLDDDDLPSPFICPLNQREMNGRHRFVYIRPCGCAMSESGLRATVSIDETASKEVRSVACPICSTTFAVDGLGKREIVPGGDVVIINGSDAEIDAQRKAMEEERGAEQERKKQMKEKSITSGEGEEAKKRRRDERRKRKEADANLGQAKEHTERLTKREKGNAEAPASLQPNVVV